MALSRQDWSWIIFIPLIALVATAGAFIIYLPIYILAIATSYIATATFPRVFLPVPRYMFVLKVLVVALVVFAVLFTTQNYISGQLYMKKHGIDDFQVESSAH